MPPAASKGVKKGIDAGEARRRRETRVISLRKEKREEGVEKRRRAMDGAPTASASAGATPSVLLTGDLCIERLGDYCAATRSSDPAAQIEGVTCIRRLLSKETNPPVEAVLAANILPRLVQLLGTSTDAKLQFEAAWAITNVASTEHTHAVVDAGAVGPLVVAMMSGDAALRDQCIWCIGNIAGDSAAYRDILLSTPGALQALMINLQQPDNPQLLRNATWTLSNFCRGKPTPTPSLVAAMVPALAFLLAQGDKEVIQDAAWGLSYLTDGDDVTIQTVLDAGVARRCVELMSHAELSVITPALRVVGNFFAGNDRQTQAALDAGALAALVPLLGHTKRTIKREACWAVSNVAAGTREQLSAVMATPGMMANVIALLSKGRENDWNVRKEAAWVVSNVATIGTADHLRELISLGVLEPLVDVLGTTRDPRILSVVLDATDAVLNMGARLGDAEGGARAVADAFEEAGLLNALETVQAFASEEVYAKAVRVIETHYGTDDEEPQEEGGIAIVAAAAAATTALPAFGAFAFGAPPAAVASNPSPWGTMAPAAGNPLAALTAVANGAFSQQPQQPQQCGVIVAPGGFVMAPPQQPQHVYSFAAFA